ncbi:hypothetical protein ETAA8_26580 [Anatilimnocola aggregata]|uniref:Uncharacterized protein n=1 Tax=Anatilimnocola aggregata TaxID=2528021 RepID=A0A517YBE2_9BACT|nr:hypothetical protein [Anatilimnocola aggregata]QDU27570.1 hypothetical protein ETAA8_26580 [Anatilimnocola aggregata]
MRWYYYALIFAAFFAGSMHVEGQDRVFEGPWKTTNRKLDGIMTAVVKDLGDNKMQGRFYGIWQGVPFDYTVKFIGPKSSLQGTAVIDHADYTWTGVIDDESPAMFKGKFGGSRYAGHFELKEKKTSKPVVTTAAATKTSVDR